MVREIFEMKQTIEICVELDGRETSLVWTQGKTFRQVGRHLELFDELVGPDAPRRVKDKHDINEWFADLEV